MVKNGQDLVDHRTLESGVSYKLFDKLSRLIKWYLHAASGGIIFGLTASLLCIVDIWILGDHCSCT